MVCNAGMMETALLQNFIFARHENGCKRIRLSNFINCFVGKNALRDHILLSIGRQYIYENLTFHRPQQLMASVLEGAIHKQGTWLRPFLSGASRFMGQTSPSRSLAGRIRYITPMRSNDACNIMHIEWSIKCACAFNFLGGYVYAYPCKSNGNVNISRSFQD